MNVQIINKSKHPLPAYATELSAGMDIRANLSEPITLAPMQRCLVPTGLYIALPPGFEAQVRPRSGLAIKKGITVLNYPCKSFIGDFCDRRRRTHCADGNSTPRTSYMAGSGSAG